MKPKILIVEDEKAIQLALSALLRKQGYDVEVHGDATSALSAIRDGPFDLVLTDLALGGEQDGMDILRASLEAHSETPVVLITAHGSEKVAVQAMKAGASDYVPKPFDNDEIRLVVERALERTRLVRENRLLVARVEREHGFGRIVGSGAAMRRIFETIEKVSETDLTVLIRGESGTGKEMVAQALHERSPRKPKPFVAVNCAAIGRELVESELFGHEKGAFTGADARRIGRFEAARGGTVFLDEIGDMPLETQAKVLRALQEKRFERVGGNIAVPFDARVLAATHRDLEADVKSGRFREDLYYRLRVVEIALPPLRERPADIPALVDRFLAELAERLGRRKMEMTPAALVRLSSHSFPGNVRELKNVVEQAAVLASGPAIDEDDLRLGPLGTPGTGASLDREDLPFAEAKRRAVETFERNYLSAALERHGGNVSKTAEAIGMVRQSLQQKLRELGIR